MRAHLFKIYLYGSKLLVVIKVVQKAKKISRYKIYLLSVPLKQCSVDLQCSTATPVLVRTFLGQLYIIYNVYIIYTYILNCTYIPYCILKHLWVGLRLGRRPSCASGHPQYIQVLSLKLVTIRVIRNNIMLKITQYHSIQGVSQ